MALRNTARIEYMFEGKLSAGNIPPLDILHEKIFVKKVINKTYWINSGSNQVLEKYLNESCL